MPSCSSPMARLSLPAPSPASMASPRRDRKVECQWHARWDVQSEPNGTVQAVTLQVDGSFYVAARSPRSAASPSLVSRTFSPAAPSTPPSTEPQRDCEHSFDRGRRQGMHRRKLHHSRRPPPSPVCSLCIPTPVTQSVTVSTTNPRSHGLGRNAPASHPSPSQNPRTDPIGPTSDLRTRPTGSPGGLPG